ncbi:hypothetical protein BGZ95_004306 [Linnemannia exigua]|uniref:BHLH domain-containing protein n=1 Tax=Linnemannia exigua TaxID=604196 RepID=A0AAD4H0V7_9FUNG|nr:hypothetical protein BGZ95_004306 [Linnemannia exigua]
MSSNQQQQSSTPPFGAPGPYPSMAYPAYYPPHPQSQQQHQQHPHPQYSQPPPHHHPQHHPYQHPYQPYPPPNYPQQYPPGPAYGHGHPTYYPQPPQQQHSSNSDPAAVATSTSPSSPAQEPPATETQSALPTPANKSSKTGTATKTPKAKPGLKNTTAASASPAAAGDAPKASSTPKTPKVFRFEGSISSESFKTSKSFDLAGVNILNRKPLDTKTALDKLQRRRETHNRVERKRRDCINQLIDDLTKLLPPKHLEETTSKCHRVNVLRGAVSHIKFLNESNQALAKSIRSIKGDDFPLDLPQELSKTDADIGMSMDVDGDDDDDAVKGEDDSDDERTPGQVTTTMSRSGSPSSSITSTPSSPKISPTRRMAPPPVIITDAPSPSADKIQSMNVDPFSAESRQRTNSFVSSISEMGSPRTPFSSSPVFPPSPTSPAMFGLSGQFPAGEDRADGKSWDQQQQQQKQQQLSPYLKHSPSPSPSLPPISSLSNMHIHSPINRLTDGPADAQPQGDSNPNPGRGHRGPVVLPPLMIPEPHHLHPSYQQSSANSSGSGTRTSGTGSNRSSLTLSPNPSEQPPISPFMLSPLLPRSPSIGPTSSISPGNSPHPRWAHDGTPSPQPYPPHGSPFGQPPHSPGYGFVYPGHPDPNQAAAVAVTTTTAHQHKAKAAHHERHKSLQPEPIFIQEEPWNTQRKRSTSSASGKVTKSGANKKKATAAAAAAAAAVAAEEDGSSPVVYPTSPNPKKRTQITPGHETADVGPEEASKRSKQLDEMTTPEVVVDAPPTVKVEEAVKADEEDAAHTLTSLAQISA